MLKVRIIKSEDCDMCKSYLPRLKKQGYPHELYDGDASENQKELDEWKIDNFPVVQIITKNKKEKVRVIFQFPPGTYSPRAIEYKRNQLEKRHDHRPNKKPS